MKTASGTRIITTDEKDLWIDVLNEVGTYSFYHLPTVHQTAELNGEGRAVMPVFRHGPHIMAFPMLVRPVENSGTQSKPRYYDATSVRGFAGPVSTMPTPPDAVRRAFQADLQSFFEQHSVISAYSRLHPLTSDYSLISGYGLVIEVGVTLSIDLTLPPEAQWAAYRSDHRKVTRRLQRKGFTCEEAGPECLDDVVRIYHQTMRRVGADEAFMFDRDYFEYLFREMPETMRLFICRVDDSVAGFHMCAVCGGVIESYLSGTADEHVQSAPSRLLYDTLRLWGNQTGARAMHLGGGVGAQRDQLYEFKAGFASNEHTYYTWRCIVDQAAYDAVCRSASMGADSDPNTCYFPAYRTPGPDKHLPTAGNQCMASATER